MTILDTINSLAAEQLQLYRELQAHQGDDSALLRRLRAVQGELLAQWDARRRETVEKYETDGDCRHGNGTAVVSGHLSYRSHTQGGARGEL